MKVMEIRLEDDGERIAVITDTGNSHLDFGILWGNRIGEVESESEAVKTIRNHLLGVIADIDWQKQLRRIQTIGKIS